MTSPTNCVLDPDVCIDPWHKAERQSVSSLLTSNRLVQGLLETLLLARALLQPTRVCKSANLADLGASQFPVDPMESEVVSRPSNSSRIQPAAAYITGGALFRVEGGREEASMTTNQLAMAPAGHPQWAEQRAPDR